jgi:hypothetical protein
VEPVAGHKEREPTAETESDHPYLACTVRVADQLLSAGLDQLERLTASVLEGSEGPADAAQPGPLAEQVGQMDQIAKPG